jgi:AraC-like DNA-binding protein
MPNRQLRTANEMITEFSNVPSLGQVINMPKHYVDSMHSHPWHQLIFPVTGLLQTEVNQYRYLVTHTSALFIPATLQHESIALSDTRFMGLYINPAHDLAYAQTPRAVSITPFMRELFSEIYHCSQAGKDQLALTRLLGVLHDQLMKDEVFSFKLLLPEDRRLRVIFNALSESPNIDWTLAKWGMEVGASSRTLSRLFAQEFSTSFSLWRQHLRLVYSLSLLDEDLSIQSIADIVGYQNDSSYIKAFKANFGSTPQQFRTKKNF